LCTSPRDFFRNNVVPLYPEDMVEGSLPYELAGWSKYKYIMHMDGISCSTRLPLYLGHGYTTLVEQSGFKQHFQSWLKPMEEFVPAWEEGPEDIIKRVRWLRENDARARRIGEDARKFAMRHLTLEARDRYWLLVLTELSKKRRYSVELPKTAAPLRESMPFHDQGFCKTREELFGTRDEFVELEKLRAARAHRLSVKARENSMEEKAKKRMVRLKMREKKMLCFCEPMWCVNLQRPKTGFKKALKDLILCVLGESLK